MSKRPWKKWAQIVRTEYNSGDVKFQTSVANNRKSSAAVATGAAATFESLTEAEQHLNTWWADWWPKQIKSSRKA